MYFCETLHFWNNIFLLVSLVLSELHYQSIPNVIRYGKIGVHFFCCFLEICPSNFVFDFFLKVFCYIVADSLLYICALCCFCCLLMLQSIFVQRNFFRLQAMSHYSWLKQREGLNDLVRLLQVNQCCNLEWEGEAFPMNFF